MLFITALLVTRLDVELLKSHVNNISEQGVKII